MRQLCESTEFVYIIYIYVKYYYLLCSVYRGRLDIIGTFENFQLELEITEIFFSSLIRRTYNVSV